MVVRESIFKASQIEYQKEGRFEGFEHSCKKSFLLEINPAVSRFFHHHVQKKPGRALPMNPSFSNVHNV